MKLLKFDSTAQEIVLWIYACRNPGHPIDFVVRPLDQPVRTGTKNKSAAALKCLGTEAVHWLDINIVWIEIERLLFISHDLLDYGGKECGNKMIGSFFELIGINF